MALYRVVPATRGNRHGLESRPWNVVRSGDGQKVGRGATKQDALVVMERFETAANNFIAVHALTVYNEGAVVRERIQLREALEGMWEAFGKCKCRKAAHAVAKAASALAECNWRVPR